MAGEPRDPAAIRGVAHSILGQSQFSGVKPSLYDRVRHWISNQIFGALGRALNGNFNIVGVVLLAAVVALIVWLVVRLVRDFRRGAGGPPNALGPLRRSPADWLAEAERCESEGDFRGALRARYRALLTELIRRGVLEEVAGRTAGEYRRAISADLPRAAAPFGEATDLFEKVVYGDADADREDATSVAAASRLVLEAAP